MKQIENYEIVPIGRAKDLSNEKFGDYTVIYRTLGEDLKYVYWLCQCSECNKYVAKKATSLQNSSNECDCRYDLTGKIFGRWYVEYLSEQKTNKGRKMYHCKCQCGNEKDVPSENLRRGDSQSCGCLNREKIALSTQERCRIDLSSQRFGKLTVISPIYSKDGGHTRWRCKCDCGNFCEIDMGNLRSGKSKSCGCTSSTNEENIIKMLSQNKIPFKYQFRFTDFSQKQFDFYIGNKYIVEYDGIQHFKYTGTGWNTKEHFDRTRISDLSKNKYCFDNKIPLIRIPYSANYTMDDLKIETTRFLITPENEDEYYLLNT